MDRATDELVRALRAETLDVLEVSGGPASRWRNLPFRSYEEAGYPAYDVCAGPLCVAAFDLVIAEQVFEHLRDPAAAARSVYQMVRTGGHALVTTPFLLKVHDSPIDCNRWTPLGLRLLLEEAGFDEVQVGSWGNRACVVANFDRWVVFEPRRHSLENEPDFPVVVWALARRARPGACS
jgi:SAM-dependent methyltransferase